MHTQHTHTHTHARKRAHTHAHVHTHRHTDTHQAAIRRAPLATGLVGSIGKK